MMVNRSKLKKLMEQNGVSIKVLSGVLDLHPYTMGKKLSGVALFDEDEIKKLSEYFKIEVSELIK